MAIEAAILLFGPFPFLLAGAFFARRLPGGWRLVVQALLLSVAGLQLTVFLGLLFMAWTLGSACGATVLAQAPSPRGESIAYTHGYSCGATTSNSMNVSVLPVGELPESRGNVLSGDGLWPELPLGGRPEIKLDDIVRVKWTGSDLVVSYDPKLRDVTRNQSVGETRIRFAPWQPPSR